MSTALLAFKSALILLLRALTSNALQPRQPEDERMLLLVAVQRTVRCHHGCATNPTNLWAPLSGHSSLARPGQQAEHQHGEKQVDDWIASDTGYQAVCHGLPVPPDVA